MFDPQRLLGQLLGDALGGDFGHRKKKKRGGGMSFGTKAQLGIGALFALPVTLGVGAAFSHFFPIAIGVSVSAAVLVCASIGVVVLLATWLPTRKAVAIEPRDALWRET